MWSANTILEGRIALNLEEFLENIISFGRNHPLTALIVAVAFLLLILRRPKFILSLFLLALILSIIIYSIMDTASSAKKVKQKLIQKSEEGVK